MRNICKKIGAFVLVGLTVLCALSFSFYRMTRTLYQERSANTQLLMAQIALNLDESLRSEMAFAEHFVKHLENEQIPTLSETLDHLATMQMTSDRDIASLFLIDSKSMCHSQNQGLFRWRNMDILASGKPCCLLSTTEGSISDFQTMLFVIPFSFPLELDECTVTHLVMATTMDVIDKFFDVAYYGAGSTSFILNTNGSQAYRNNSNSSFGQSHNLLNALQDASYHYGTSSEQLKENIANRRAGCIHIQINNQAYYLAYEPLSVNDWMAVMMIEEEHIAGASAGFVSSMTASIALVAVVAVVAIVSAVVAATRSANRRLVAAADAERKANEAKTRFLSAMSHDIRTPMNAIIGMTNLATQNIDDRTYALDCLAKVRMSSDHLLTLINDVLDISKVESGKMHLTPSVFSLEDEVKRLVEIVRPQVQDKNQTFTCHMHGLENKMVYADKLRLNQVMLNILSNAVKYTQAGGTVELEISGEPGVQEKDFAVVYRVQDNGIGMSEEYQKNMYDTFTREDNEAKRNIQGSGLGLAICKQMVDMMGGTIICESAVGVGTTFTVTVTLQRSEDRDSAQLAEEQEKADADDLAGLRILVAEDNELNWEIAAAVLGMSGIDATRAENGQICMDTISAAEDGAFDLILMDIQMPIMNGYEASRAIRSSKREYLRTIPIIAMTADAFSEDIHRCMEAGMNAHISKPIDVGQLLQTIKKQRRQIH